MKKTKALLLALILVFTAVGCSNNSDDNNDETNNKQTQGSVDLNNFRENDNTFIKIGDEEISHKKFYNFYDLYSSVLAMQRNLSNDLTQLFVRDVIVEKDLKEDNITVSDEEVDQEVELYKTNLGGEEEFENYISVLGTDIDTFRENIKDGIQNTKHMENFISKNKATDEDIKDYYEKNKDDIDNVEAKHILVKDENTAKEISKKLNNGEDFKKLSVEYSIDEAAKKNGGELGKVTRNGFDKDFVEAAYKLKDDEISEPVKTQFGYHIIQVTKNNVGLDNNKDQINEKIGQEKYNEYMNKKMSEIEVKVFDSEGKEKQNQQPQQPQQTESEIETEEQE